MSNLFVAGNETRRTGTAGLPEIKSGCGVSDV